MYKAIGLAEGGRRLAHPNPMVGAVIVKNGEILAGGFHQRFGGPHAEVSAIKKAGVQCKGATLYVTLEPCSTTGKTPPCVEAVIKAGFSKVVVGAIDPNPAHKGCGIRMLRNAGIEVVIGVLRDVVARQNEVFFTNMQKGRPFVTVKLAMSLDGKIATATGESRWISSEDSRRVVHELRACSDAVLIGVTSCIMDKARLNIRGISGKWKEPYKVIIDPRLELPFNARVLKSNRHERIIILTKCSAGAKKFKTLIDKGVNVRHVRSQGKYLSIRAILKELSTFDIRSVVVEGGSGIVGSFFDARLVDKVCFFVAPKIIGGKLSLCAVGGKGIDCVKNAFSIHDLEVTKVGCDHVFVGYPNAR
ncbi:MAG: bifunctional diaminohydroxyphosphoribosylaminopyrimidine deaminase/5-amino-6-(5-phosphoribosylamino)uracil reductase RibD [Candidatus Omnitrophica bacterium]|nr:bifunctional diaminohydroxyphosphoribosylaminopyrimidine deaminase/5-amino-6-(5-phosphoribosylamino)uracil reductase RibD [Candidatus Omnitrophota bacterium]